MIPIKINTWGKFVDNEGKTGRLIIENVADKFDFRLYKYYDNQNAVFDEWLENIGFIEFALMEQFTTVTWETQNFDDKITVPYFLPDKTGKISTASNCIYSNFDIIICQVFTDSHEKENYNIPEKTPAWLISIKNIDSKIKHNHLIIQDSTMYYFFQFYNIKIDFPNYFDLESVEGLLSAIFYWQNYIVTYDYAQKEIFSLINALTQKIATSVDGIELDAKIVKSILAAWHTQPESVQKSINITQYEKLLAKYSLTEPAENKIAALQTLTKSRPLLVREQLELETLQSILAAQDTSTIDALLTKISNTPTEPELRKKLIAQAQAKRDLIVDDNI